VQLLIHQWSTKVLLILVTAQSFTCERGSRHRRVSFYRNKTCTWNRHAEVHQGRWWWTPHFGFNKWSSHPPLASTVCQALVLRISIGPKDRAGRSHSGSPPRHSRFHDLNFRNKQLNLKVAATWCRFQTGGSQYWKQGTDSNKQDGGKWNMSPTLNQNRYSEDPDQLKNQAWKSNHKKSTMKNLPAYGIE